MTKTTPILLDRLAGALAAYNVTLKRTHLLQVAARALGYDNTHSFSADDKAGKLTPPAADYLGCNDVSGYGMMEFFGDPEGGIFAVQKDRIEALKGRKDDWILSPTGSVLDISAFRSVKNTTKTRANNETQTFAMITDPAVRHIIETGQCDEDSICRAITFTKQHFDVSFEKGQSISALVLGAIGEAEFQWNEKGNAAGALEALTIYWNSISQKSHEVMVSCGNCDWTGRENECNEIDHFHERVGPGETVPAGECPKCGALAHLVEKSTNTEMLNVNEIFDIDLEQPIYLTNGCCEHAHSDAAMMRALRLNFGEFDGEFFPLTKEESEFIAEDLVTSEDGRMHALTGYSALYRGKKHVMPSIELPVGPEHDAPPYAQARKEAEQYITNILPKVEALGGNILLDNGFDGCIVIQMLFPLDEVMKFKDLDTWFARLKWIMVDPTLPDHDPEEQFRHEGRNFAVSVEWLGEGEEGDFQPLEPRDQPLLRFDAQKNIGIVDNVWEDLDNGSYCTQVPAYAPREILEAMPRYLVARLEAEGGNYPKRLMEQLSWVTQKEISEFIESERKSG